MGSTQNDGADNLEGSTLFVPGIDNPFASRSQGAPSPALSKQSMVGASKEVLSRDSMFTRKPIKLGVGEEDEEDEEEEEKVPASPDQEMSVERRVYNCKPYFSN